MNVNLNANSERFFHFRSQNMAAKSIFQQLTAGISFDTKKFSEEATKFGFVKKKNEESKEKPSDVKLPNLDEIKKEVKGEVQINFTQ